MSWPWISRKECNRLIGTVAAEGAKQDLRTRAGYEEEIKALRNLIEKAKLYNVVVERTPPGDRSDAIYTVKVEINAEMAHYIMGGERILARHIAGDVAARVQYELEHICGYDKSPFVR